MIDQLLKHAKAGEPKKLFSRSFESMLFEKTNPLIQRKHQRIFHKQQQVELQSMKGKMSHLPFQQSQTGLKVSNLTFKRSTSLNEESEQIQQPKKKMHRFYRQGNSIQSFIREVEADFDELEEQINSFKTRSRSERRVKRQEIQHLKTKFKNKYSQDSNDILFQIKNHIKEHQNLEQCKSNKSFILKLSNSNISKKLQSLRQFHQDIMSNYRVLWTQTIKKHADKFTDIQNKIEKIQENYFDFTKTKMIKLSLSQGIEKHQNLSYKKTLKAGKIPPPNYSDYSSPYQIVFNEKSFSGLQDRNWLHNSVIDNYIAYLKLSQNYNSPQSRYAIYTFNQTQYILDSWQNYKFSNGPIFTKFQKVGMVVNVNNDHWFFMGFYKNESKLVIYDSVPKSGQKYRSYTEKLQNFIRREEKQFNAPMSSALTQIDDQTTPKQSNGSDCGIHVICNLTYFLNDKDQNNKIMFDESFNGQIRVGIYHFMSYLFYLGKNDDKIVKYDWLEYASKSLLLKEKRNILWK